MLQLLHHLIGDHSTLEVLHTEVEALLQGRGHELPAPQPFRNLVAQARLGIGADEHERFFRQLLGDIDEPTTPFGLAQVHLDGSDVPAPAAAQNWPSNTPGPGKFPDASAPATAPAPAGPGQFPPANAPQSLPAQPGSVPPPSQWGSSKPQHPAWGGSNNSATAAQHPAWGGGGTAVARPGASSGSAGQLPCANEFMPLRDDAQAKSGLVKTAMEKKPGTPEAVTKGIKDLLEKTAPLASRLSLETPTGFAGAPLASDPDPLLRRARALGFGLAAFEGAPTAQQKRVIEQTERELDDAAAAIKAVQQADVPALNTLIYESGIGKLDPGPAIP